MGFIEKKFLAKNNIELTYVEDPYPVGNSYGENKIIFIFFNL